MKDDKKDDQVKETVKPEQEGKKITLTEEQLEQMLRKAQADGQEAGKTGRQLNAGGWEEFKPEKSANKKAKMKLYRKDTDQDFSLLIDWKRLRHEINPQTREVTRQIYKLTLLGDDGKEWTTELPWEEFIQINDYEEVEIVATNEKLLRKSHGLIRKTPQIKGYTYSNGVDGVSVDSKGDAGEMVEAFEVAMEHNHVIKRPNGQTLTIHNSRLNP